MKLEVLPGPSDAVDVVQIDDDTIASDRESVSASGFRDGVHLRIEKPVPAVGGGEPHHLPRAVVAGDRFRFPRWHKAILLSFPVAHIPLLATSAGCLVDLLCGPPDDLYRGGRAAQKSGFSHIGSVLMPLVDSTDTSSVDRTMAWFFQLNLEDRAALLADPEMELPPSLVAGLSEERCVASDAVWTSHPQPTKFRLAPRSVEQLQPRRNKLLRWWNALPADEQTLLIDSRDQALPERYRATLLAGEGAVSDGSGLVEVLPMTRAFLEWQAYAKRQ